MKSVSIVIAVRPGYHPEKVLEHIRSLNYPPELIEVLIVEGQQPSLQRNMAVLQARGEIIYFLDDDSCVTPDCLVAGLSRLGKQKVAAVGGPALSEPGATFLQELFAEVSGSIFGTLHTRTRFRPVGKPRLVKGEELILCNLLMSRRVFLEMSGLDVRLYPNEENELFKRMRRAGFRFCYLPQMIVRNVKRESLGAFVRQMFSYGKGRGNHILRGLHWKDMVFFIPSVFVLYLVSLAFLPRLWPLFIAYLLFISVGAGIVGFRRRSLTFAASMPPLFFLMHVSYGIGLMFGLWPQRRQPAVPKSSILINRIGFNTSLSESSMPLSRAISG